MYEPLCVDYAPLPNKIFSFLELLYSLHALQYPKRLSNATYIAVRNRKKKGITNILGTRYSISLLLVCETAARTNIFLLHSALQIYIKVTVQYQMVIHS